MDASMVVHQLQKLASDPNPPASVRQKLPRMALGICYFIEHPDKDVKTQAAAAARLLVQKHGPILCKSPEYADILKALESYSESQKEFPVVKEYCDAAVSLLKTQYENVSMGVEEDETQVNNTPSYNNTSLFSDEVLESLDLFSIVLGLRGILNDKHNIDIVVQYGGTLPLVELQRYLQRQIVNVWGVSSATITLNTELLSKQVEQVLKTREPVVESNADAEEGDGIAVVLIRLSRRPTVLQKQLSTLREAVGSLTLLLKSSIIQKATAVEPVKTQAEDTSCDAPQYLDSSEALSGDNPECSLFETLNSSSPGGFSFFSANSYLFGSQCRTEGTTIQTYDIDPELSSRLRKEKARRAEKRMQKMREEANRGFVSKLFSSFAPTGFW